MSRWWWKRTAPSWCKPPCGAQPFLKDSSSAAARTALLRGDSLPILSPLFHPPTLLPLCPSLWLFHAFLAAVMEEHELGKCVSAPQHAGAAGGPGRAGDTEGRSQPPPEALHGANESRCTRSYLHGRWCRMAGRSSSWEARFWTPPVGFS